MKIKTLIVEDDADVRQSLQSALGFSEELSIVGSYGDAETFLEAFPGMDVDVVIMDIQLPGKNGIQAVKEAKMGKPNVQFLMWTSFDEDQKIFDALCEGATGYLLKKSELPEIIQSITSIFAGGSPMSPAIARKVIETFQKINQPNEHLQKLSEREQEILQLLAKGFRYKEIAYKLFLSIETVRTHIRNIYSKLQVQSSTEAINKAYPRR